MRHRLLLSFLCLLALSCSREVPPFHATELTGATFGRQLKLPDVHGRMRSLAEFRGKAVIVMFGYTACPDVCPTSLARFAEAIKALGPAAQQVQLIFVSLDPERDLPKQLQDFVSWFHPGFLGLRGDVAQTRAAADEFRVFSSRREIGGGLGYVLDHSTGAYLYDPAGRLRLYVRDTAPVADIAADLQTLVAGG